MSPSSLPPPDQDKTERLLASLRQDPPRRIFVFCREHIGDVVNSTGALASLRDEFPEAQITVQVGEVAVPVLSHFPGIHDLWSRPYHEGVRGKIEFLRNLRAGHFDLAVIFDDSNSMVLDAWLGGISRRIGVWRGKRHRNLFSTYVPYRDDQSDTRDNFGDLMKLIGCPEPYRAPILAIGDQDRQAVESKLRLKGVGQEDRLVAMVPGARQPQRRWPTERFAAVAEQFEAMGLRSVVLGSEEDRSLQTIIQNRCPSAVGLVGELTILETAAALERVERLITNDTGPLHMAAALGVPIVGLYGPGDPVSVGPYGIGHTIFRGVCDCPIQQNRTCGGACMHSIKVSDVLECVSQLVVTNAGTPSP